MVAHIATALICFCIILPLGAITSLTRWDKSKAWFARHFYIQIFGGMAALSLVISGPLTQIDMGFVAFAQTHDVLGLSVLVALLMQLLNGLLRPHAPNRPNETVSSQRRFWL